MLLRASASSQALPRGRATTITAALKDTALAAAAAATAAVLAAATHPGPALAAAVAPSPSSADGGGLTLRFKASPDPAIRAAQQELVESWALASALFVDADAISKPEWHDGLTKALDASFALGGSGGGGGGGGSATPSASPADGVRKLEDGLLAQLGDPFTRVLRGPAAERLAQEEEGRVVSNGLALLPRAGGGGWAVAYVAPGGPAEAASVRAGDAVLAVDGAAPPRTEGSIKAAREAFLARVAREPVTLRLSRAGAAAAGARADGAASAAPAPFDARLSPRPVDVDSVRWGVLHVPRGGGGAPPLAAGAASAAGAEEGRGARGGEEEGTPVAYLRIAQFSQRTPAAVREAMEGMFGDKGGSGGGGSRPRALLIDLRDNPGGVVEAGVEAARQLLRPGDALAVVTARSGGAMSAETSSERVVLSPLQGGEEGGGEAQQPALYRALSGGRPAIAVLTNHNTASTAELLVGALRDGGPGAEIVGEKTFGKGRTQRVMQLQSGGGDPAAAAASAGAGRATLLVSTMRFATPTGAPIDGVGLKPAVACASPAAGFEVFRGGAADVDAGGNGGAEMRALLEGDECVRRAAEGLAAAK